MEQVTVKLPKDVLEKISDDRVKQLERKIKKLEEQVEGLVSEKLFLTEELEISKHIEEGFHMLVQSTNLYHKNDDCS
ncbi:MAG: hypothetical protein AABY07_01305 [Nanoarchaeota archaeon]